MAGLRPYLIEGETRGKVLIACLVLSLVAASFLNGIIFPLLQTLAHLIGLSEIYQSFLLFGLFGTASYACMVSIAWKVFDHFLWKQRVINQLINIPNLKGVWKGTGYSSYEGNNKQIEYSMELKISQTFTKMECHAVFENSDSYGNSYSVSCCNFQQQSCLLSFAYGNDAGSISLKVDSWEESHFGYNIIQVVGNSMSGRYFTNRSPQTKGYFELEKQS